MFVNPGAVNQAILSAGELVTFWRDGGDDTTKFTIRGEVTRVDATSWNLLKAGLRPHLDLAMNAPTDSEIETGYKAEHDGQEYRVVSIQDAHDSAGIIVSRLLLLSNISPGGVDLG